MRTDPRLARQGFSLVELLVVLVVVGFMMALSMNLPFIRMEQSTQTRLFFNQLNDHIKLAQEIALTERVAVQLLFHRTDQCIYFLSSSPSVENLSLCVPEHIILLTHGSIHYATTGHVSQFQSQYFFDNQKQHRLQLAFQLGSGRFVYRIQEMP